VRLKQTVFAILVAGCVLIGLVFWWLNNSIEDQRLSELREDLHNQAALLSSVFDSQSPDVDRLVDDISRGLRYRITVIRQDGKVVGDSDFSGEQLAALENHADRTEIVRAKESGSGDRIRYSPSLHTWLMYSAVRLRHSDGFVRVATSAPQRELLAPSLRLPLGALLVAAGLAAGVMYRRIARTVTEPGNVLERWMDQAAEGQSGSAPPIYSGEELGPIARSAKNFAEISRQRFALIESEADYLKAVLASMTEGVMITDTGRHIGRVNPAFVEIFHLDRDPVGQGVLEVVRNPVLEESLRTVLTDQATTRHEVEISDDERILLARISRLEKADQTLGAVVVFHDITGLRRLENVRKEFVSNLSHEFRTPLTSIRGYAETLLDEPCDSTAHRDFLPKIQKNAEQLSQMIEELFKLASLEAGGERLEKQVVDLGAVVAEVIEEFAPRLKAKGIRLVDELEPNAQRFTAQEAYLRRILHNLVDNASKYTRSGLIKIAAQRSGEEVIVAVSDTGIGIPPEDLKRIFERFYRVDKDRSRETGGSGIGLALVKHLVQVQGGRVWAESTPGQGSTFYFALPAGGG
jgi:two-component system phosphate regulon sensor histidine kinase PhoR